MLITKLQAELESLQAKAERFEKVRDYFDADVPASVEHELVLEQKLPDPSLVPVQIDVPVSM